jgi:hypothetical protein
MIGLAPNKQTSIRGFKRNEMKYKIPDLPYHDWFGSGNTKEDIPEELMLSSFHAGKIFKANLFLRRDDILELREAIKKGIHPIFELDGVEE